MLRYRELLQHIASMLEQHGVMGYIVGGIARDIMLDKHINAFYDIDIALVIRGIPYSCEYARHILYAVTQSTAHTYDAPYTIHDAYYTSSIHFDIGEQSYSLDYALARTESYPYPAAQPSISLGDVEFCSIYDDIYRRDFTINALAFPLESYLSYVLSAIQAHTNTIYRDAIQRACIALPHAIEDCASRVLRYTHKGSFIEDPTRMLRLLIYMERYQCSIECETERAYYRAYKAGMLSLLSTHPLLHIVQGAICTANNIIILLMRYLQYGVYAVLFTPLPSIYTFYEQLYALLHTPLFKTCSQNERSFLLYSVCTHHSLHLPYMRTSSLYQHMTISMFHKKKVPNTSRRFYPIHYIQYHTLPRNAPHTKYIEQIRSYIQYTKYAESARKRYCAFYAMLSGLQDTSDIRYHIAYFCATISPREIIYIALQSTMKYKIILEEYLQFKYTKQDRILFSVNELPAQTYIDKKELFQHVIASIFVHKLYTKEEQLQCAIDIVHRLYI